jgi:cytochrome oxidase Cu insertion factor (SCO1/SenC/PrrC family)
VVATQPPAIVAPARLPALHGEVLAIDRVTGRVLVRHAPFEGMPAMTMSFRLASGAPALHVGDAVRGLVDEHTDPWTLRDVHVVRAPSAAKPQPFVPVLREGDMVPATALVDEHGRPFSLQSSDGRTTIVSFIYTRCRDASMCPLVSAKFARMQRAIGTAPIRLLLLTLDPSYDTPAVLARYGAAYGADPRRWTFATGEPDAVENLAARLGINATRPVPGVVVHRRDLAARRSARERTPRRRCRRRSAAASAPLARRERERALRRCRRHDAHRRRGTGTLGSAHRLVHPDRPPRIPHLTTPPSTRSA